MCLVGIENELDDERILCAQSMQVDECSVSKFERCECYTWILCGGVAGNGI